MSAAEILADIERAAAAAKTDEPFDPDRRARAFVACLTGRLQDTHREHAEIVWSLISEMTMDESKIALDDFMRKPAAESSQGQTL